ncbi:hypothetical protein LIER_04402 [Lithospermum erythrorhizon]|uniref:Uncharacterized protein n=1 Tax=Lithospermum erythrorhizon TaxID=34254 RepID=A0AAV3NYH7_LITER
MEVDLDNYDVLSDSRYDISQMSTRSRYQFTSLVRERSENCEDCDADYLNFLLNIPGNSVKESGKDKDLSDKDLDGDDHVGNSVENFENEDSDDADPPYKLFWSHVKGDGKSFTFEIKYENGNLKTIEYQKEEPIDSWHNPKTRRNMNNVVENRRKRSRSEPKKSKSEKRGCLRSLSREKSNIPSRKHTSRNQSVSCLQPKLNKDGLGKMGEVKLEIPLGVGRNIIKKEQESLIEEDYQCFLSSAEVVSNIIHLPLKSDKRIVYDEEVDLGYVVCHDVKTVSPRSSGENNVEEDDSCQILGSSFGADQLREKVMSNLRKPFDDQEYNTLWNVVTQKHNISRPMELRFGRDKSVPTEIKGKSYLEQHEALRREIEAVPDDKYKRLNLLRGFFFWLQHVAWGSTFKPWEDGACLAVMPGSH